MPVASLCDGFLDRWLEAPTDGEHDVGGADRLEVVGGELEIVGLDARRGQVRHRDAVAADPLGDEREGVEARDGAHMLAGSVRRAGVALAGRQRHQRYENKTENRSHFQ